MKEQMRLVPLAGFVLFALIVSVTPARAVDPDPAIQKLFNKMLDAIKTGDRAAFVADGTEEVKKGTSQEIMDALNKGLGARLKSGYQATYLCSLKQSGFQQHLWKLAFKDKGDDVIVRMVMKDGKVFGFFLQ